MDNAYMRDYMAERRAERREKLIEFLGGKCGVCSSVKELEFDHIVPGSRSFTLSGCNLDKAWVKLLEEIKKCQLLCNECHRVKTNIWKEHAGGHNKIKDPKHGTAHMYLTFKCKCLDCKYARSLHRKGEISYNFQISAPSWYKGKRGRPSLDSVE